MATTKVDVNLIGATGTPGSGNFLRGDGSWQAVGGAWNFISSTDISDAASFIFTAVDASSYDAYQMVLMNVIPATDDVAVLLTTSTDGGSSYDTGASDYSYTAAIERTGAYLYDYHDAAHTSMLITGHNASTYSDVGSAAGEDGMSGTINVWSPHLAKRTKFTWMINYDNAEGQPGFVVGSGTRLSSADVDAWKFAFASGNIESGTISVYGLANS